VACLQLLGNYHPNILGCLEVLQDDEWLYTVVPYCSGGDLYSAIRNRPKQLQHHHPYQQQQQQQQHRRNSSDKSTSSESTALCSSTIATTTSNWGGTDEVQARQWFRQLLEALLHLQRKGVCHRGLCLENILIEDDGSLVVVDFGLALRVPYADSNNPGGISDVSEGTTRLLIRAQGQSGLLTYMAPEILDNEEAFDGFTADLWSAGVLLFVFLVGLVPFKWPSLSDCRYAQINRGRLRELMACNLEHQISNEAVDLMQNMMWRDPRKRLTLAQVLQHPWVLGETVKTADVPEKPSPVAKKSVQLVAAFPAMSMDKQQLRQVDVR
jgi:serine/threonine protein kinase